MYVRWYWTIDIHNLMRMMYLRLDTEHAQAEIAKYFHGGIYPFFAQLFPVVAAVFWRVKVQGMHLTGNGVDLVRDLVNGYKILGVTDDALEALIEKHTTSQDERKVLRKLLYA
jgi:thymidylate synthase ThyX